MKQNYFLSKIKMMKTFFFLIVLILLACTKLTFSQSVKKITGRVETDNNKGVAGATVLLVSSGLNTQAAGGG